MKKLTRAQIRQIQSIIRDHMEVLMLLTTGDGQPSSALLKQLKLPKEIIDLIKTSYQYGKLGVLQNKDLSTMSKGDIEKLLAALKLTPSQRYSIEHSKIRAQQAIDSMTQRIVASAVTLAVQSDLSMWEAVKEVVPTALKNSTPRYQVIQQLREKTGDMMRDWHRIAHTEMWNAKVQGEADAILNNESPLSSKGADTLVFKRPFNDACPKCKQMYLESDGITPRVFKLSELMGNGTNYGKKQADWVATLGVLHPNCRCPLSVKPDNTEFDSQGNLIYVASKGNV